MTKTIRKMCVVAGIAVLGTLASAMPSDAQIFIDRALNSPTLTVRYNGANATLVELRLNGESIGTRTVNGTKSSGETNFTVDLNSLKDGDNEVEIRLFDRTGKLIGSDKTNISTNLSDNGPIYLTAPKVGATVMSNVDIKVGFGKEMKDSYVSFFVDEQFKSMTNFPPYEYLWDTTRESNGWHEVEAWVVDNTSSTFKTRKVRVFVNNPGGRTDRPGVTTALSPAANPLRGNVTGAVKGVKPSVVRTTAVKAGLRNAMPRVSATVAANPLHGPIGTASGIKPLPAPGLAMTGVRNIAPKAIKVAAAPKPAIAKTSTGVIEIAVRPVSPKIAGPALQAATTAQTGAALPRTALSGLTLLPITKGQHIPNVGTFSVFLNSQVVAFDVQPRVDNGVPMTPFRYLIEKAGGKVDWQNLSKSVKAFSDGRDIFLQIGDQTAKINDLSVSLETAPYLDRGRTIVPLSFISDALNVNIDYDKSTNHVLITKK